ncbi:LysM domain-containing protein [Streptomyces sp. TLI_235]|nr:transglycosylase family protein [Streptomyces sp. TLI_235]PBC76100.1 LysM domain-containing protein [Streptomyces sp. TLI_235]
MGFIGSGRHRRPTQTERAVAVAGVAGAGLAIPLLTATGAHAAPVTTWDAVAQCATAGNWGKAAGNGEYGGLQLDLRTWVAYGGDKFASTPDRASKEEQISVAERVLADRGAKAWGHCATTAGLTGEGKPETVEPTVPTTPAPTTTTTTTPTERGASAPVFTGMQGRDANGVYWYQVDGQWYWTTSQEIYDYYTGPAATAPGRSNSTTPTPGQVPTTPPAPGTGTTAPTVPGGTTTTAPGTPAPDTTTAPTIDPITGLPVTPAPSTGAPTATDPTTAPTGPAAPASTSTATEAATATPAPQQTEPATYTVAPGDTLSDISNKNKLGGWKSVYDGNSGTIGQDPDLIKPGQVLKIK